MRTSPGVSVSTRFSEVRRIQETRAPGDFRHHAHQCPLAIAQIGKMEEATAFESDHDIRPPLNVLNAAGAFDRPLNRTLHYLKMRRRPPACVGASV